MLNTRQNNNRRRGPQPSRRRSRSRSPRGRAQPPNRDRPRNLPPPPNPLPPRPQQPLSFSQAPPAPGSRNASDNYRPAPPPSGRDFRQDSYNTYDQYDRNDRNDRGPPPPNYPPPPSRSNSYSQQPPPGDSYRPGKRPPQGDFTFRVPPPPGVDPLPPPQGPRGDSSRRRDNRNNNRGGPRRQYTRVAISERPILTNNRVDEPQVHLRDDEAGVTYKAFEDLSDDEEHDMDISDESDKVSTEPALKRRRQDRDAAKTETEAAAPKWSNPDAYTALAPEANADRRKKDVVQLIRKARVEAADATNSLNAELEDIISFGTDSEDNPEPSSMGQSRSLPPPPPPSFPPPSLPPPPPPPPPSRPRSGKADRSRDSGPGPLGSRKRTADDQIKGGQSFRQPRKMGDYSAMDDVVPEWQPVRNGDACPWAKDHSETPDMAIWLHKELVDFYSYTRPREFEQAMRRSLVENLRRGLRKSHFFKGCEVRAFGSFISGLYLPTADMDLVVCSNQILRGRGEDDRLKTKKMLFKFRNFLASTGIPIRGSSPEVIVGAKVPLVKYVDSVTGLKVDVSFENISGITAIETFLKWRDDYPCMPILVTVIKQFLAMRALNEPVSGGIGSFTVICLVVSMLQMMPQLQSRSMTGEHNLGELLIEFFDLYGNKFEYQQLAIRLNPPGYVPKDRVTTFPYKNLDRLSVIDPNNEANDISGGSRNFFFIAEDFSSACSLLKGNMAKLAKLPPDQRVNKSILEAILGGDYSSFEAQRDQLRKLHRKVAGPCNENYANSHPGS